MIGTDYTISYSETQQLGKYRVREREIERLSKADNKNFYYKRLNTYNVLIEHFLYKP